MLIDYKKKKKKKASKPIQCNVGILKVNRKSRLPESARASAKREQVKCLHNSNQGYITRSTQITVATIVV